VINLLLAASLNQLWSLMNGLQVMSHLTLFGIVFPPNANVFMVAFVTVANFEIVPTDIVYPLFFELPECQAHSSGFELTGYESIYVSENLGTIFVLMHVYAILYIASGLLFLLGKKWNSFAKGYQKLAKFLFWNGLIRFFIEAYLELSLAVIVNLVHLKWDTESGAELYSSITTVFYSLIVVGLPIFLAFFYGC